MREIKFKIWDTVENKFLKLKDYQELGAIEIENDGTLTLSPRFRFLTSMMIMPERLIPLQFTGLYDKNGVEIYEGDIVEYVYVGEDGDKRDYKIKKGVMNFKNNGWHINSKWLDGFTMNMFQFEVIGNIYDNKENR